MNFKLPCGKKQRGEVEVAPGYWNDEKRSMPLLPWLPASRKKRFPVTKRSPKATENELVKASAAAIIENDEKIAQDLRGIFGAVNDDVKDTKKKKKRSMEETVHDKNNRKEAVLEANPQQQHSSMMMMAPHHSHVSDDKKRNLKKRSSTPDDENEENDEENGNFAFVHARLNINKTFFTSFSRILVNRKRGRGR